jgi:hypothetical protein
VKETDQIILFKIQLSCRLRIGSQIKNRWIKIDLTPQDDIPAYPKCRGSHSDNKDYDHGFLDLSQT